MGVNNNQARRAGAKICFNGRRREQKNYLRGFHHVRKMVLFTSSAISDAPRLMRSSSGGGAECSFNEGK
jgi:hypothetical protein